MHGGVPPSRRRPVLVRAPATLSIRSFILFCLVSAACAYCWPAVAQDGEPTRSIHVVSNGWHSGIVLPRSAVVAAGVLPEAADLPDVAYLEFGWGDRDYYTASEPTIGMSLRAGLTPTSAVLHVAGRGRGRDGTAVSPDTEIIEISLSETGLRKLIDAIAQDFERPDGVRATPISAGLTPASYFYQAKGAFHAFNTCNTWSARKLLAGGVGVQPSGIVTATDLMKAVRAAVANRPAREQKIRAPGR